MQDQIERILRRLEPFEVTDIDLIAFVTRNSYQVVFFGDHDDETFQSNEMMEEDIVDTDVIERIYEEVSRLIRNSPDFHSDKMNIVTYNKNQGVQFRYDSATECDRYQVMDDWIDSLPE